MARSHRRGILAEGNVAHAVGPFDAPVAAAEGLHCRGVHLGGGATAQEEFDFFRDADRFEVMGGADQDGGLRGVRETGLRGRRFKGIDLAGFLSAVPLVHRDGRREKKTPSGLLARRAIWSKSLG